MSNITATQKRNLRSQAHNLKPIVIIGGGGVTNSVLSEIDRALFDHELIKIKVNALDKKQRQQMIKEICDHSQAVLIQTIGHMATIYRERIE